MAAGCASSGVRVIAGVELSVQAPSGSMHLLGYFPGTGQPEPLGARLAGLRAARETGRTAWSSAWPPPARRSSSRTSAPAPRGAIGRPHVADALVAAGHARDRQDAFDRYLADGGPGLRAPRGPAAARGDRAGGRSGGASVLAHPASLRMPERELRRLRAAPHRLGPARASRCTGPTTRPSAAASLARLARRHRLVATGGSDFHRLEDELRPGDTGRPPLPADVIDHLLSDTVEP